MTCSPTDHKWQTISRRKTGDGRWMVFQRCSKCGADNAYVE